MRTQNIIFGTVVLLAISCVSNQLDLPIEKQVEMTFSAEMADNQNTKTVLQNDRMSIWWSPTDSIMVYAGEVSSGRFISTNTEPASRTSFSGTLNVFTGSIDNENDPMTFWAVYPYRFARGHTTNATVDIYLPREQVAADNTFAPGMFPSVAKSENLNLSFYNVCGGIVFTVDGEDIKTVTLSGNNEELIAGEGIVSFDGISKLPYISTELSLDSGGHSSIILYAPDRGTFTPGVRYFISVYPQTFEQGFTLTFFKSASKSDVTWTKSVTIKRSRFLVLEHADAGAGEYEYAIPEEAYKDMDELNAVFAKDISSNAVLYIPDHMLFNMCGDDLYSAGSGYGDNSFKEELNEFRYNSENDVVNGVYLRLYDIISHANTFIGKYEDDLPGIIGLARVMRAYSHMILAIGWGTPPLVDHVLANEEKPYNCDRDPNHSMTHEKLLEWCAQECEAAAETLDERENPQDVQGAYRITKGFAQAIAGKAYLFAGNYEKAKEMLGAVINSGKYALVPGDRFWENFHIEGDGNEEKVYEPNFEYYPGRPLWGSDGYVPMSSFMESNLLAWREDCFVSSPYVGYSGNLTGWGGLGVRVEFAESFVANDGEDSYRLKTTMIHIDDVIGGQMYGNWQIDEMTKEQKLASHSVGIRDRGLYGQCFWLPFKQLIKSSDTQSGTMVGIRWNNYTVMRYAEVLLLYAEACLQTGDNAQALWAINQIQARAGSKTISTSVDMDVLKREKMFELWFEGCRWADLIRWGDTDGVEQSGRAVPILYDKFTRAPQQEDENVVWEHGTEENSRFYTVTTHGAIDAGLQVGYVEGKHNRFPYPLTEIEGNSNLVQNPGW